VLRELTVWDAVTGREALTIKGHTSWVSSVAFSPDGKRIVSGSGDKTLKIWDAVTGKELLTLKGHTSSVSSVAFSPDGQWIVSGSGWGAQFSTLSCGELKVWDALTGQEALTLKGHTGSVTSVAFSPDGKRIVSGSRDATLKLWDTPMEALRSNEARVHYELVRSNEARVHYELGLTLGARKRWDEAAPAYCRAIAIKPDYAEAYYNLGLTLRAQSKPEEAADAYRKATDINHYYAEAHYSLGNALRELKKPDEAAAAFRTAIAIRPQYASAHNNLGIVLREQHKLQDAVAAFREAARLLPNHAMIRNNLRVTERWLELEKRLPAIQAKREKPRNPQEYLELGDFCRRYKHHYAAAAGFFSEAFAAEPKLAADLRLQPRYHAAHAAILAAAGQGEDARALTAEQLGKLRQRALEWLRADLDAYSKLVETDNNANRLLVRQRLSHRLQDPELASVRETQQLATLPEQERKSWEKLWADAAALLKKCE
jgi:tetratricopeptide (TPR) repeat protein